MKTENQEFNQEPRVENVEVKKPKWEVLNTSEETIKLYKPDRNVEEYYITFAGHVVYHEKFKTTDEAEKTIKEKPIELLVNIVMICTEQLINWKGINNEKTN